MRCLIYPVWKPPRHRCRWWWRWRGWPRALPIDRSRRRNRYVHVIIAVWSNRWWRKRNRCRQWRKVRICSISCEFKIHEISRVLGFYHFVWAVSPYLTRYWNRDSTMAGRLTDCLCWLQWWTRRSWWSELRRWQRRLWWKCMLSTSCLPPCRLAIVAWTILSISRFFIQPVPGSPAAISCKATSLMLT